MLKKLIRSNHKIHGNLRTFYCFTLFFRYMKYMFLLAIKLLSHVAPCYMTKFIHCTKMKFFTKDFFSKCDQNGPDPNFSCIFLVLHVFSWNNFLKKLRKSEKVCHIVFGVVRYLLHIPMFSLNPSMKALTVNDSTFARNLCI